MTRFRTTMENTPGPRAGRKEWVALGVLMLPLLLVSMDVSILYFAIPYISQDLEPSATQQLWILDMYGFVLAGLLITMGALGDRIGRRTLVLTGAAVFGAASVAAAYAHSADLLIAVRALLGLGGAALMPSTLALIRNLFRDEKQRGKAVTIWTAVMTTGISLGPVVSGLLLEHYWWGSVFLINLPAMVLLLALVPFLVPESTPAVRGRLDPLSAALSLGALLPVIYGIKEWARHGYEPLPVLGITVGLVLGFAFVRRQRHLAHPMIDLGLLGRLRLRRPCARQSARYVRHGGHGRLPHPVSAVRARPEPVHSRAVEPGAGRGRGRHGPDRGGARTADRPCVCHGRRLPRLRLRFPLADPGTY